MKLPNIKIKLPLHTKRYAKWALFSLSIVSIVLIIITISAWFDINRLVFRSPILIKVQAPIVIERRVALASPLASTETLTKIPKSKADLINLKSASKVITGIWTLESNRGNYPTGFAKYCESLGKSNEFGFDPYGHTCFDNFEASVNRVENWLVDVMQELSLDQTLCFYNTGIASDSCIYSKNYHSLEK